MTDGNWADRLKGKIPAMPTMPDLGKDAGIPVYLIHNSPDPEDYFFIIDFEEFVERSSKGMFVRPRLKILAGRDDFSRTTFARQFREVFAGEFDRMRDVVAGKNAGGRKMGWLTWTDVIGGVSGMVAGFAANIVLMIALSAGKSLLGSVSVPAWMKGKSASARLEDDIAGTKTKVEAALANADVALHPELYDHAYRGGMKGPNAHLDREAWPLPQHVRDHLSDGSSGSWW